VAARRPTTRQRVDEANATGIGWCRRVAGRKPHSRARVERSQGVPARRFRLQKSASGAWVQRSVSPVGSGARGRGPQLPTYPARGGEGERGDERRDHGGQAVSPGKSGAGRSRGRCGATVLARWKTFRIAHQLATVTRASWRRSRRLSWVSSCASGRVPAGEATGMSEVRIARVVAGRQRPPRRTRNHVRPTEANRTDVNQARFPRMRETRKRHDASGTDEARVLVRET
jgi:hypothetical protein